MPETTSQTPTSFAEQILQQKQQLSRNSPWRPQHISRGQRSRLSGAGLVLIQRSRPHQYLYLYNNSCFFIYYFRRRARGVFVKQFVCQTFPQRKLNVVFFLEDNNVRFEGETRSQRHCAPAAADDSIFCSRVFQQKRLYSAWQRTMKSQSGDCSAEQNKPAAPLPLIRGIWCIKGYSNGEWERFPRSRKELSCSKTLPIIFLPLNGKIKSSRHIVTYCSFPMLYSGYCKNFRACLQLCAFVKKMSAADTRASTSGHKHLDAV